MNIIFEGISGSGKTTTINALCEELKRRDISYENVGDLEYETPIKQVLLDMVNKNTLMKEGYNFKTSIYESLLLAANHHYVQEKLRNKKDICIYDRDYISVLAYQKEIMKAEYENWQEIYDAYRKIMLFDLKKVDYVVYMKVPFEVSLERTQQRDGREMAQEDVEMLKHIEHNMKKEIEKLNNGRNVIYLDGTKYVRENVNHILNITRMKDYEMSR